MYSNYVECWPFEGLLCKYNHACAWLPIVFAFHPLASLSPLETVTGVTLNPFVAEVSSVEDIRCTAEVDHTFTVPLQWFMEHEPELAEMDLATRPGATFPVDIPYAGNPMEWRRRKTYFVYIYRYEGYHIWGMTAQIVKECIDIIKAM